MMMSRNNGRTTSVSDESVEGGGGGGGERGSRRSVILEENELYFTKSWRCYVSHSAGGCASTTRDTLLMTLMVMTDGVR
jgi:hypothetical protein